jgi:hypothetical protein
VRVTEKTMKKIKSAAASTSVSNPVCKVSLMRLLIITSVDLKPVLRMACFPGLIGRKLWKRKGLTRLEQSATVTATSTRTEAENQKMQGLLMADFLA